MQPDSCQRGEERRGLRAMTDIALPRSLTVSTPCLSQVAGYVPISDIDSYARAVFDPIQQRINEIRSSKSQVAIADQ